MIWVIRVFRMNGMVWVLRMVRVVLSHGRQRLLEVGPPRSADSFLHSAKGVRQNRGRWLGSEADDLLRSGQSRPATGPRSATANR